MKIYLFTISMMLYSLATKAQQVPLVTAGTIEFDKVANMYQIITRSFKQGKGIYAVDPVERYKKTQPQFLTLKSQLIFADNKTLFTPIASQAPAFTDISTPTVDQNNIVYTDHSNMMVVAQKKIFESTLLLKDTLRKIKWKLTDETREIAGYNCRRANGLMLDSIYVVAFYTDEIHIPGGPESFGGLPGMILQIAIPHENISWIARSVIKAEKNSTNVLPPKNGKAVDQAQFKLTLRDILKNFESNSQLYWKAFLM